MRIGLSAAVVLWAGHAAAAESPPPSFFVGEYELVGRAPGKGGRLYSGWVVIAGNDERVVADRCIDGKSSSVRLDWVRLIDDIPAVRFSFELDAVSLEATCAMHVDFENYGRLTCSTYPARDGSIGTPGIEALFHAKWPRREPPCAAKDAGG